VGAARRERSAREAAGLQQQRDGRWAVARVVEARRERSGGVLEWKGVNPVTGVAWEDSWVRLRDLSVAARLEARGLLRTRRRGASGQRGGDGLGRQPSGDRRSERLAAMGRDCYRNHKGMLMS
jgi:hypothetical protein